MNEAIGPSGIHRTITFRPASAGRCRAAQLELSFLAGQGAAGTIFLTFRLRNTGSAGCQLRGFVRLQMLDEAGQPLPTRVIPNGGTFSNQPPPSPFTLPPQTAGGLQTASFYQQFNNLFWSYQPSVEVLAGMFSDYVCHKVRPGPVMPIRPVATPSRRRAAITASRSRSGSSRTT